MLLGKIVNLNMLLWKMSDKMLKAAGQSHAHTWSTCPLSGPNEPPVNELWNLKNPKFELSTLDILFQDLRRHVAKKSLSKLIVNSIGLYILKILASSI